MHFHISCGSTKPVLYRDSTSITRCELWTFAGSSILFILVWELWDCHAHSLYLTQQLVEFVARSSVFLLTSRRDTWTDRHVKTRPVELRCLLALYFGKFISTSVWHFRVLNCRDDYCNYEIVITLLPISISKSFIFAPVLWYYEHRKAEKMRICATLRFLEKQMKLLTKIGSDVVIFASIPDFLKGNVVSCQYYRQNRPSFCVLSFQLLLYNCP